MYKISPYILFILVLSIFACQPENTDKDTWFVGKIDNPTQDYIILKHNRILIDTVNLDNKNFFRYRFNKPVTEGMYSFEHVDDYPFYIAEGDSLLLLTNTIDFEASLYFSNDHAAENNLLMKLNHRLKNDNFYWSELHEYTPEEFNNKLTEREKESKSLLQDFIKNNPNATKRFLRIAEGVIEQDKFLNKERYIQAHRAHDTDLGTIPNDFYEHRKKIDFQKDTMEVYYPYYRLLHTYLDNRVLDSFNKNETLDRSDYELNKYKLNLIDTIVDNVDIKNCLLYSSTRSFLLYTKGEAEEKEFLSLHNNLSTCPISKSNLLDLSTYTQKIKPGSKTPDVQLLTTDNTEVNLLSIIKQPTVLYFWSFKDIQHQKTIHIRVKELKSKFPEYQFIGINTDDHFKKWRSEVSKLAYQKNVEYQLYNPKLAEKELVITTHNKVLILDNKGVIHNGHANIYQRTIENELLQYLN